MSNPQLPEPLQKAPYAKEIVSVASKGEGKGWGFVTSSGQKGHCPTDGPAPDMKKPLDKKKADAHQELADKGNKATARSEKENKERDAQYAADKKKSEEEAAKKKAERDAEGDPSKKAEAKAKADAEAKAKSEAEEKAKDEAAAQKASDDKAKAEKENQK